ncbi:MAG: hypothetical protein WDW38_000801 [Sanguina aurantia]
MQDATADVSDTADQQDHPLQAQLADQDYDEEGMFEGQPLTILFDLNGVLVTERGDGGGGRLRREFNARPNVAELVRLLPRFRLGVFSSATQATVDRGLESVLEAVWQAHGQSKVAGFVCPRTVQQLFPIVYHRAQTLPNPQWRTRPGGKEWDTVKPLDLNGLDVTHTLLVDNELDKAYAGEEGSLVIVPTWEGLADQGLSSWDVLINGLLAIPEDATDLRLHSNLLTLGCSDTRLAPPPLPSPSRPRASRTPHSRHRVWIQRRLRLTLQPLGSSPGSRTENERLKAAQAAAPGGPAGHAAAAPLPLPRPRPQTFVDQGVETEHLEVIILLGLLQRARPYCTAHLRNAASQRRATADADLGKPVSLNRKHQKIPQSHVDQPGVKWSTIKKFVKELGVSLHHHLTLTTKSWEGLLSSMTQSGKLKCYAGPHVAGSMFEAISVPTLEQATTAVTTLQQKYAELLPPTQGPARTGAAAASDPEPDGRPSGSAPVQAAPGVPWVASSWIPRDAPTVQALAGLMEYCTGLHLACGGREAEGSGGHRPCALELSCKGGTGAGGGPGAEAAAAADARTRMQLRGVAFYQHVEVLVLMALLRAAWRAQSLVAGGVKALGPGLQHFLPASNELALVLQAMATKGWVRKPAPATSGKKRFEAIHVPSVECARAAIAALEQEHSNAIRTQTPSLAHGQNTDPATQDEADRDARLDGEDGLLSDIQQRLLHAQHNPLLSAVPTSAPASGAVERSKRARRGQTDPPGTEPPVSPEYETAKGVEVLTPAPQRQPSSAPLVNGHMLLSQFFPAVAAPDSGKPQQTTPAPAKAVSLKRSRVLAGAQPLNDNYRHRHPRSAQPHPDAHTEQPAHLSALHHEVASFALHASSSELELQQLDIAMRAVQTVVASIWPHARAVLFGSQASGLSLPGSDLDIVILGVMEDLATPAEGFRRGKSSALMLLKILGKQLRSAGITQNQELITAKVPIVKTRLTLQHPLDSHHSTSSYSGQPGHRGTTSGRKFSFAADISMGVANGVAAVYLYRDGHRDPPPSLHRAQSMNSPARCTTIAPQCLPDHGLGGISSYSLVQLAIAHLQCEGYDIASALTATSVGENALKTPKRSHSHSKKAPAPGPAKPSAPDPGSSSKGVAIQGLEPASVAYLRGVRASASQQLQGSSCSDLGALLKSFCSRFGNVFDYRNEAVSVVGGGVVEKAGCWQQSYKQALAVEDPQQEGKDIGAGSYNIGFVQQLFSSSLDALMSSEAKATSASHPDPQHPSHARAAAGGPTDGAGAPHGGIQDADEDDTWRSVQEDGTHGSLPSTSAAAAAAEEHHGVGYDSGGGRAGFAPLSVGAYRILAAVLDVGAALGHQPVAKAKPPSWPDWGGGGSSGGGPAGGGGGSGRGEQSYNGEARQAKHQRRSSSESRQQGTPDHHNQQQQQRRQQQQQQQHDHHSHHRRDSYPHSDGGGGGGSRQQEHEHRRTKRQRKGDTDRSLEAAAGASRSNSHATAGPASGKEAAGKQRRAKQRESTSSPGNRKQVDGKSPKKILKQKKKKVRASHEPKAKSRGGWSAD